MINCSATEVAAIKKVFENDDVSILLCHWHIKRAWEVNLKKHIKVAGSKQEGDRLRDYCRLLLDRMMHGADEDSSTKISLITSCLLITFYTNNNLIESYHNQLKTYYFGRARSLRVDRLVYLLSVVVTLDYQQDRARIKFGIQSSRLSKTEEKRQRLAYQIEYDIAAAMMELVDDIYIVKSFITQDVSYQVLKSQSYLSSCYCLDQIHLCKHIFLVHRVEGVTYYAARSSLSLAPPPAALPSNSDETENPQFEDFYSTSTSANI
ncbi:hypothetical protein MBANPS3_009795 [Mucor bainieri]